MDHKLLEIRNLTVHYVVDKEVVEAVNEISLTVEEGDTIGLVGETGAGKTTTALSIMGLVPNPPGKVVSGEILLNGEDLLKKSNKEMRKIRGKDLAMIFQDPMTSLNPVMTVGDQITEVIQLHEKISKTEAQKKACAHAGAGGNHRGALRGISAPVFRRNEAAGDHRHRPGLQPQAADRRRADHGPGRDHPGPGAGPDAQLKETYGTAMILITHDLGVVAEVCDQVAIMYAGEIVEKGTLEDIYNSPRHPYTDGPVSVHTGSGRGERAAEHLSRE